MAKLYHSTQQIATQKANQINPGVARLHTDTGLQEIGKATFSLGQKLHQINVARQTARAVAAYNMQMAEFMAKMQTADPSKVDYQEEWSKFVASQGNLTKGMSRDAAQAVENKLTQYNAFNFNNVMKLQIQNTRDMVMAEAPEIMENTVSQQAKAQLDGQPEKAQQAEQDFGEWIEAVGPTLRPGEKKKLLAARTEALEGALAEEERQRVYAAIMADPMEAAKMIPNMKYQTPQKQLTLLRTAEAQNNKSIQMNKVLESKLVEGQSSAVLDTVLAGDVPMGDFHEDVGTLVEAIQEQGEPTTVPTEFYQLRDKLQRVNVMSDYDLLKARAIGIPSEQVEELRKINKENQQLMPQQQAVKNAMSGIDSGFRSLQEAATAVGRFEDADTQKIIQEIHDEKLVFKKEIRKMFLEGKSRGEILSAMQEEFEPTKEGILKGFRMFRPKKKEFTEDVKSSERAWTQGLINLLQYGEKDDAVEDMIDLWGDMFPDDKAPLLRD